MKKATGKISATFEFNSRGKLKMIYLGSRNEEDQKILEYGLSRLLRPGYWGLLKRLFGVRNG
jgi:hypothetical protein